MDESELDTLIQMLGLVDLGDATSYINEGADIMREDVAQDSFSCDKYQEDDCTCIASC